MQEPLFALPPPSAAGMPTLAGPISLDVTQYTPGDRLGQKHTVYRCECGKPAILVGLFWCHRVTVTASDKEPIVARADQCRANALSPSGFVVPALDPESAIKLAKQRLKEERSGGAPK